MMIFALINWDLLTLQKSLVFVQIWKRFPIPNPSVPLKYATDDHIIYKHLLSFGGKRFWRSWPLCLRRFFRKKKSAEDLRFPACLLTHLISCYRPPTNPHSISIFQNTHHRKITWKFREKHQKENSTKTYPDKTVWNLTIFDSANSFMITFWFYKFMKFWAKNAVRDGCHSVSYKWDWIGYPGGVKTEA